MKLDIEQLIAEFGGPGKVAERLNRLFPEDQVSRAAVYKWRERGTLPLAQLAAGSGKHFDIN